MQPNKSRKINVTLNAAGLAPGPHMTDLVITSNDPDTARLRVPVTLMVAEAAAEELEVQIVNQTAKSATIAWITNRPTTAEIHYGTNRQQLNSVAQDVRSQNQTIEDDVHYVVLKDLKPNTQYFFKITPAGQTPTASHTLRRFTTGPDTAPGSPQVIYGRVFKDDETAAQHVLVLLRVIDTDDSGSPDESALLAGLTDGNGYWINPDSEGALNLNSLRTKDSKSKFNYTAEDKIEVEILGGADCNAKHRFDMGDFVDSAPQKEAPAMTLSCTKLVDMALSAGWTAVVFPPLSGNNGVSSIMGDAVDQNAAFQEIAYWNRSTADWVSRVADVPIGNFSILPCRGYFIRVDEPSLYRAKPGTTTQDSCTIDLVRGWNFISLSATMPQVNASDACQQIRQSGGRITEIARWDTATSNWNSYICNQPFGDFVMESDVPYFVKSNREGRWVPQKSEARAATYQDGTVDTGLAAVDRPVISDIRYTNLGSNQLTIVWRTDQPATGQVHIGRVGEEGANVAYDDRDEGYVGTVHQVTIPDLRPESAYQLWLQSGETVHDNEGAYHLIETGPTLAVPQINTAYGQVLDGAGNPVVGAEVYAAIEGAVPLSALTDHNGYWTLNLGSLRTADGMAYFAGTEAVLDIEVTAPDGKQGNLSLAMNELAPAPTLELNIVETEHHIYLPVIAR